MLKMPIDVKGGALRSRAIYVQSLEAEPVRPVYSVSPLPPSSQPPSAQRLARRKRLQKLLPGINVSGWTAP
jgi:hypothetical protein